MKRVPTPADGGADDRSVFRARSGGRDRLLVGRPVADRRNAARCEPLLDDRARRAKYVLLGSASPEIVSGVSESLAGRIGFLDLSPFLVHQARRRAPRSVAVFESA